MAEKKDNKKSFTDDEITVKLRLTGSSRSFVKKKFGGQSHGLKDWKNILDAERLSY